MDQKKIETEVFKDIERLKRLRVEHRDLDDVISRLADDPLVDQLELKRLKKRKLMLKDTILKLESELIPDLNA
ncbi:MAG: YdcH family protein [Gammaproteobacteria bacterium]|nr:YdcH family protein [Gammaproteobacteria bacterium]NND60308.1 YdcH family protein [Gammaproteobacteria bacterium]